eukprot:CAMPEP_0206479166 /NCGR_PEP_ID=MMETSP0324_2-20121206/36512_1 /ASSEMBLY_ACC=CAM_ASM_000836 /TAXON_ID=2866 /ORGANISM="Crypthecodinium cohnii, Strain Seligo" /LENGTH=291 /DNA_ID=CAMNT_0053955661 /DNA_START=114 /DNA_END=986 /DNA_ORIENTATION=-
MTQKSSNNNSKSDTTPQQQKQQQDEGEEEPPFVPDCIDLDSVAVVTGAASGFGLELAARLACEGMSVAMLDSSGKELKEAVDALREDGCERVVAVECDVNSETSCQEAARQAQVASLFPGKIGLLFNDAGMAPGPAVPVDDCPKVSSVNLPAVLNVVKAFLPPLLTSGQLPSWKKKYLITTSAAVALPDGKPTKEVISSLAIAIFSSQLDEELVKLGRRGKYVATTVVIPTLPGSAQQSAAFSPIDFVDTMLKGLSQEHPYIFVPPSEGRQQTETGSETVVLKAPPGQKPP